MLASKRLMLMTGGFILLLVVGGNWFYRFATSTESAQILNYLTAQAPDSAWLSEADGALIAHFQSPKIETGYLRQSSYAWRGFNRLFEASLDQEEMHLFVIGDKQLWEKCIHRYAQKIHAKAFSFNRNIFVYSMHEKGEYPSDISHEMMHILLHSKYSKGIPLWLEEGLALHYGFEMTKDFQSLQGKGLSMIAYQGKSAKVDIFKQVSYPDAAEEVKTFYRQSRKAVGYLLHSLGEEAGLKLLDELAMHHEDAMFVFKTSLLNEKQKTELRKIGVVEAMHE